MKTRLAIWVMFALPLTLLMLQTAWTRIDPVAVQKLRSDDSLSSQDYFGCSVSLDGDTVLIGAMYDDASAGSAYVFARGADGTWRQQAKLTTADASWFGGSVSVDGSTALIGAVNDNTTCAAYVFVQAANGTWTQQAKLVAPEGTTWQSYYGWHVSLDGDTALLGVSLVGAGYVFVRNTDGTWMQQAKLTAPDGSVYGYRFGHSVFIDGDTALISDPGDNEKGSWAGAAYVFVRKTDGTWMQQAKLTAVDASADNGFGKSVSMDGDTALISAEHNAYVFIRETDGSWMQQAKLAAPRGWSGSVSVNGGIAVIGTPFDSDKGAYSGAAYVFVRDKAGNWTQQTKLAAPDGSANDWFGRAVAVDSSTVMIGMPGDDYVKGSVYVYRQISENQPKAMPWLSLLLDK